MRQLTTPPPRHLVGSDPKLEQILALSPSILKGPSPPWMLQNRHMQFVPWMIQNEFHRGGIPFERHEFNVSACLDKGVKVRLPRDEHTKNTLRTHYKHTTTTLIVTRYTLLTHTLPPFPLFPGLRSRPLPERNNIARHLPSPRSILGILNQLQ